MTNSATLTELKVSLRKFAEARDWEQFHQPKNLVLALVAEVGELAELFQWLTPTEAAQIMEGLTDAARVREELADVFAYLLRLADVLAVDLAGALIEKMEINDRKYPVHLSKGSSRKSSEL